MARCLKGFENLLPMRDAPSTPLATVKEPWLLSPFWGTAEATCTDFSKDHHGQSWSRHVLLHQFWKCKLLTSGLVTAGKECNPTRSGNA